MEQDVELQKCMARMVARYFRKKAENKVPTEKCVKCKSSYWEKEDDTYWYCFKCGNRAFWRNGEFFQHASINQAKNSG